MQLIRTEPTPNPAARKFILDSPLLSEGYRDMENASEAASDPLGRALFAVSGVEAVFYMDRFITIRKSDAAGWPGLEAKIAAVIQSTAVPLASKAIDGSSTKDPLEAKVRRFILERIGPALAKDGGGLEIIDFQDFVLTVNYRGACVGCPAARSSTLPAIERALQYEVDERIQVINDDANG